MALIDSWREDVALLAPTAPSEELLTVGTDLLRRWGEPHRRYHTTTHLAEMLSALREIEQAEELALREAALARVAAWFHDAVYAVLDPGDVPHLGDPAPAAVSTPGHDAPPNHGAPVDTHGTAPRPDTHPDPIAPVDTPRREPRPGPGDNEEASARLAVHSLTGNGFRDADVGVVASLIRASERHELPSPGGPEAAFHDADLWILAAPSDRFDEYCTEVREEFAVVPDAAYRMGRSAVLRPFLDRDHVYATHVGRAEWEPRARVNLARELARLG